MNKINYDKITCAIIEEIKKKQQRLKLLLHVCCAPCSSYCLEWLKDYFDIYIDFYNPNLDNKKEYDRRLDEVKRLKDELKSDHNIICILNGAYNSGDFEKVANLRKKNREGGKACKACYYLRLKHAAICAISNSCDYFTTTLSISPMKSSAILNEIGDEISKKYKIKYLYSDFKKRNGYKRSIELSKQYALYRQDYCGCIFSKYEREFYERNKKL